MPDFGFQGIYGILAHFMHKNPDFLCWVQKHSVDSRKILLSPEIFLVSPENSVESGIFFADSRKILLIQKTKISVDPEPLVVPLVILPLLVVPLVISTLWWFLWRFWPFGGSFDDFAPLVISTLWWFLWCFWPFGGSFSDLDPLVVPCGVSWGNHAQSYNWMY